MVELTETQQRVLYYLKDFFDRNDQLPSYSFICDYFGWSSLNSARDVMKVLAKKGYIEKNGANHYKFKRVE